MNNIEIIEEAKETILISNNNMDKVCHIKVEIRNKVERTEGFHLKTTNSKWQNQKVLIKILIRLTNKKIIQKKLILERNSKENQI